MVELSKTALQQKAVLWVLTGLGYNSYGNPIVSSTAVEIRARYEQRQVEILTSDNVNQVASHLIFIDRQVELGSIIRLGELTSVPDTPNNLLEVIDYNEIPDIKGKHPVRVVSVRKAGKVVFS